MQPSGHFQDFQPELLDPVSGYASELTGTGRWFVAVTTDRHLVGIVWTDDIQGLGVIATGKSHQDLVASMLADLRGYFSAGFTAASAYDQVAAQYSGHVPFTGGLQSILTSLQSVRASSPSA